MKKVFLIFTAILIISSVAPVFAIHNLLEKNRMPANELVLNYSQQADIISALKHADAQRISRYFGDVNSMKLPESSEMASISKNQAGINLKLFFEDNNINSFALTSERELGSTRYIAGKLRGAKEFNITIMLKGKESKQNIVTVRIN